MTTNRWPDGIRVAVVGPESSGKTTLVQHLRGWLERRSVPVVLVPEQGRLLAERLPAGHAWSFREQVATSRMHQGEEAAAAVVLRATPGGVLLVDGTTATPAVWHLCACAVRPEYDRGEAGVTEMLLAAVNPRAYDLVLLLAPDIPWEPDGIRDDPAGRWEAFRHYHRLYPDAVVVAGQDRLDVGVEQMSRVLTP